MTDSSITEVPGIRVGHHTDEAGATGCTVVLCEPGAVAGVDVRGSAPGTRETDLLAPTGLVEEVHAIVLSGGSAFGLDAASGVVRFLEERGIGFQAEDAVVPIVPAAVLYDLGVGDSTTRPGAGEGYSACLNASARPVEEGSVGAGTGATAAKLLGRHRAVKGGLGTSVVHLGQDLLVGAVMAVNALGGVYDPETGALVAGPRRETGHGMTDPLADPAWIRLDQQPGAHIGSTTIGVVATNARLTKAQANKVASVAHDGLAMAVRPAHTMGDGDTIFALATGDPDMPVDMLRICAAASLAVSEAVVRGVTKARGLSGIPGVNELVAGAGDTNGGDGNGGT